ncbi:MULTISPECIES: hypothetical protein [Oceanospirillaceae]|jgi:hypothetical protein|uniref:hypothetical protein n=1 Tax=Oceanospirillaceae TaxID=135620 RepID=UPI000C391CBE|nr:MULTISPECIES: hypothetical protein [Thalassolituus]PIQ39189.1 MAG: hypothetical protein COW58_13095 [Thalassolituus sp. CG17_big_fil_post_rev_8_21_14_2_50_53_8]MCA6061225.1 hypothetical protein [Thalassolituus sp. ST750PaO-4]MCB2388129.1 hypothetical protein [Thalassolituus alkanivorans]MCB2424668.1 hypothetical protein [Thalassolituus alkanivorans]TVV45969.1 hypothetical protein FOT50_03825 [Thalassolituus sp. C2-1]
MPTSHCESAACSPCALPSARVIRPQQFRSAQTPQGGSLVPVHEQQRLAQLELQIRSHRGNELHPEWLNEYLDLGLELACRAGERQLQPLQESWLTRLYNTLRDATFNSQAASCWRCQCLDYLYQPFFALQHLYRSQPERRNHLSAIVHEFSLASRYLN